MTTVKKNRVDRAEIFMDSIHCGGCGDPWDTVCKWCLRNYCITHLPPHLHQCKVTKLNPQPGTELYAWLKFHGYYKVKKEWRYRGTKQLWKVKR